MNNETSSAKSLILLCIVSLRVVSLSIHFYTNNIQFITQ